MVKVSICQIDDSYEFEADGHCGGGDSQPLCAAVSILCMTLCESVLSLADCGVSVDNCYISDGSCFIRAKCYDSDAELRRVLDTVAAGFQLLESHSDQLIFDASY